MMIVVLRNVSYKLDCMLLKKSWTKLFEGEEVVPYDIRFF